MFGGVWINGLRPKRRFIAYLVVAATIVPASFLLVGQPEILAIFNWIVTPESSDDVKWSAITSFSCATISITLLLIAVAYRFDGRCRPHWFNEPGKERGAEECCQRFFQQVVSLAPWIAFAVIASATLTIPRSISSAFQTSAVRWSLEYDYLFEHVGMMSPIVPMIVFPIAFVTLGAWWVVRHLLVRVNPSSKPTSCATPITEVPAEELSSGNEGIYRSVEATPRMTKRRWGLAIIGLVAVITITRFAVAEVVPISRELAQDWTGDYQSTLSHSVQGRQEALDCANELSSRLITLRGLPPEQLDVESSQRCLDLYYRYRNAPTHRLTFDFAMQFMAQSLTLALIGSIVSAGVWTAISSSAIVLKKTVQILAVLIALTGLTMTFAQLGWLPVVERWDRSGRSGIEHQRISSFKSSRHHSRLLDRVRRLLCDNIRRVTDSPIRKRRTKFRHIVKLGVLFGALYIAHFGFANRFSLPLPNQPDVLRRPTGRNLEPISRAHLYFSVS